MSIFSISDYGALGDGKTNDATAIQKAIDQCTSLGGGRVLIPAGKIFVSGRIRMKSNVELHLEHGAILKASPNREDYSNGIGTRNSNAFITTDDGVENIAFTGGGIIDGASDDYIESETQYIYKMKSARWTA